ncbi:hypothetical protein BD310DRAFT_928803 [Dichomitus squalens]|uniref:Uncharacterized protein n=1 Tax=Dichomitus squalens TaxID=114155 RepID=A0A4Q9PTB0_9APHY|nr:hypothetical protein BD310DRAFT_928803 [Dichomitus squalens]
MCLVCYPETLSVQRGSDQHHSKNGRRGYVELHLQRPRIALSPSWDSRRDCGYLELRSFKTRYLQRPASSSSPVVTLAIFVWVVSIGQIKQHVGIPRGMTSIPAPRATARFL